MVDYHLQINRAMRRAVAAVLVLGVFAALPFGAASSEPFSTEKRDAIRKIIKDYLMANPEVLRDALVELEKRQQAERVAQSSALIGKNAEAMFKSQHTYVAGNPDGDITLVEFFDYNCGFCKRSMDSVIGLIESDPNIRIVMREFPILGQGSLIAARAALASRKQNKYWAFHVALMKAGSLQNEAQVMRVAKSVGLDTGKLGKDMDDPQIVLSIKEGYELAEALGIQGTPTFVLDDQIIPNATNIQGILTAAVERIRANGGCRVC